MKALRNGNVRAFLRVIRQRESSQEDSAYTIINGGQHFTAPPWRHPWHGIPTTQGARASGAYQFLGTTWAEIAEQYQLPDFSPLNQDVGAVGLLVRRGALEDVLAGRFDSAVAKCRKEWTSLPGAAESSSSWTMEKALAVYVQYGGKLAAQKAAPIDDDSTEETIMDAGTAATGIGALLGMLNPAAGILFSAFAPMIKQKIVDGIDKHSNTPGAGVAVADALSEAILAQAKKDTGKTDDLEAVAVARQNPAMVEAAQQAAVLSMEERLKQLAPVLEKTVEFDKAKWQAELESKRATSAIAIEEYKAGLWDMTCTLVTNTEGQVWFILVALAAGVGAGFWYGKDAIAYAILTLAGPILGQIMKNKAQPNDYRFDGTKASSDQSKAVMDVMKQDSAQRGAS